MGELKAGVAKVDITPAAACWMEGYASRRKDGPQSTGVHDRLHARVLVVEGESGRAAIVSCDLCNLDPQTVDEVRELVCEPLTLAPERLMVVTTHNHAGPVTEYPHNGAPKTDVEWLAALPHRIACALARAAAGLRPARLGIVRGESHIGLNRQQMFDDGMVNLGKAPENPTDTEIIVACFDTPAGEPIARLVNFGCHNTSLGPRNSLISADYAGRAMSAIEDRLGGGAICTFINGGAGNVDPMHRVLGDAADPRVQEVADAFTTDVTEALGGEAAPVAGARVAGRFRDIALPRKTAGMEAGLGRFKRIRAQALRIGSLVVVGSPNEIVCEIAMNIKEQSPAAHTMVAAYCYNAIGAWHPGRDGVGGYIPTAAHYEDGGYEVRVSPYAPDAEVVFTREMVELADAMTEGS